jgi:hypothetical protein
MAEAFGYSHERTSSARPGISEGLLSRAEATPLGRCRSNKLLFRVRRVLCFDPKQVRTLNNQHLSIGALMSAPHILPNGEYVWKPRWTETLVGASGLPCLMYPRNKRPKQARSLNQT